MKAKETAVMKRIDIAIPIQTMNVGPSGITPALKCNLSLVVSFLDPLDALETGFPSFLLLVILLVETLRGGGTILADDGLRISPVVDKKE